MIGCWLLENKLNRMIEMGKLSKEGIKKAGKAGMFKPYKTWKAGLDKGSENILKKTGYSVERFKTGQYDGFTEIYPRRVNIPNTTEINAKNSGKASLIKRHEANESESVRKLFPDDIKAKKFVDGARAYHNTRIKPDLPSFLFGGSHAHPSVLQKERKYNNIATQVYGKKAGEIGVSPAHRKLMYSNIDNKSVIKKFEKEQKKVIDNHILGARWIKSIKVRPRRP